MLWLSFLMLLVIGVVMGISGIGGFLLPPLLLMIYEIALNEAILLGLGAQILIYAAVISTFSSFLISTKVLTSSGSNWLPEHFFSSCRASFPLTASL